ncbi:hypothetical protein B566_EDAN003034 [Ephemera danica]|nr:hypothetical protein B566_EDAN003034 [Ephemera danica]
MSTHLTGGKINVEHVQELAKKDLLQLLERCDGTKAIVWDEHLVGLVNTVAHHSFLKEHDVEHMFAISDRPLRPTNVKNVIFLTRPQLRLMDLIAEHVHGEEKRSSVHKEFHIFFLPRKSMLCETRLKNKGVYGNFTGHIHEFSCDLFPFDNDVMSMEIDSAFKELYVEDDPSCLYQVAQALMTLQALFGPIAKVSGQGRAARQVVDLLKRLRAEQGAVELNQQSGIDHVLLIDRGVDLLSPLATQLTYEGLIDELFGINNTMVALPEEKFSQSSEPNPMLNAEKKMKNIALNSAEELFAELRDKNFSAVGPALSRKARLITAEFETRHGQTVQQMKQFVARLPLMTLAKQSLATHTSIAEMIQELTDSSAFREALQLEQDFVNGVDTDKVHPLIEDLIAQKEPLIKVLRLVCMQSACNSGLKSKVLDYYKREIVQTYGFEHLLSLINLEKAGLLRVQQSSRPFTVLRKTLRLVVHDGSETNPTDASYVHSVYAPLTARLAQHLVSRAGWRAVQDVLPLLPGPTVMEESLLPTKHKDLLSSALPSPESNRVVLIFFIGGCTFAEISALRFLAQQEEVPVEFVVATTKLINGNSFIKSLMEQLIPEKLANK